MIRFSDRIGVTKIPEVLQLEGMSGALRNSLWNHLLGTIFKGRPENYKHVAPSICRNFFKLPLDALPNMHGHKQWLRQFFFSKLKWFELYNLLEFIAVNVYLMRSLNPNDFMEGVNRILEEELSGYRFIDGVLAPISNPEEIASITSMLQTAKEKQLFGAQKHIETALCLIAKKPDPDYRNSIKESISAIESVAKKLTGETGGGLDKALSKLDSAVHFHGAFKAGLLSLYGYTSDQGGIRHAILEESSVGFDEAKFMLISCSALVNFIIAKANKHGLL